MFDIGWSEIALIVLVAVIVLGPKEMPNAMRQVARAVRAARNVFSQFQYQLDELVHAEEVKEIKKSLAENGLTDFKTQVERELQNTADLIQSSPTKPDEPVKPA